MFQKFMPANYKVFSLITLCGTALFFVFVPWWGGGTAFAVKSSYKECKAWCKCVFPAGPDRDQCIADAKNGQGLCYTLCGPGGFTSELPRTSVDLCEGPDYASTVCCADLSDLEGPVHHFCAYSFHGGPGGVIPNGVCVTNDFGEAPVYDCFQVSYCSGNGYCDKLSGQCVCGADWIGSDCGTYVGPPIACSSNAECPSELPFCFNGTCSNTSCDQVDCLPSCFNNGQYCSGNGICVNNTCQCSSGFIGPDCFQIDEDVIQLPPECPSQ